MARRCLEGKVVLVTGAGRGLGRAIALRAARCGAAVAALDIDEASASETARSIAAEGGEAMALQADVSRSDQVEAALARVRARWERIDGLVNNAGVLQDRPVEAITDDDWDRMMAVNLKGVFLTTRAVLPGMMQRRSGSIVNVASMGAKSAWPLTGAHYCASKGGVLAFTRQVARQAGPHGVRVNAVAPGTARTEMIAARSAQQLAWIVDHIPLGRLAEPDDVAAAVVFLLSDEASYITGYTLDLNGGAYVD